MQHGKFEEKIEKEGFQSTHPCKSATTHQKFILKQMI